MKKAALLSLSAASLLLGSAAYGNAFYIDTNFGMSKITTSGGYFGTLSGASRFGFGAQGGLFYNFGNGSKPIELQLGIQTRYFNVQSDSPYGEFGAINVFPALRLQLARLMVGGGFTSVLWKRVSVSPGTENFARATGSAMFLEGGYLIPVTPKFSLAFIAGMQTFSGSGSATAIDGSFSMRFWLTPFDLDYKQSAEYTGWRYPKGNWIGPQ